MTATTQPAADGFHIPASLSPLVVSIESLEHDPENARVHDTRNIETIKESLQRFGQTKPIVLASDGKTILAGNGTFIAAKELNATQIAAVKSSLTAEEARAYAIADNRSSELSGWDAKLLGDQLLQLEDSVRAAIGYEQLELERLIGKDTQKGFRPVEGGWLRTKEEYEQMAIKNIHLFYNTADYEYVTRCLDKLANDVGAEDHATALLEHFKVAYGDYDGTENADTVQTAEGSSQS